MNLPGRGIPNDYKVEEPDLNLDDRITEGGTAMIAWVRMQFSAVAGEEQENFYVN